MVEKWVDETSVTFEKMPEIACIALLECPNMAIHGEIDYSALILIWFQERYAFPIDPGIMSQIQNIDCNLYAKDYPI